MQTSIAVLRPLVSPAAAAAFIALLIMFLLGGVSGYLVSAASAPAPIARAARATGAACPSDEHAVVYYTAKAWSCEK